MDDNTPITLDEVTIGVAIALNHIFRTLEDGGVTTHEETLSFLRFNADGVKTPANRFLQVLLSGIEHSGGPSLTMIQGDKPDV